GRDVGTLPERGDRRGREALGKILVVEVGYVVDDESAFALRGEKIFAAVLDSAHLGMKLGQISLPRDLQVGLVLVRLMQNAPALHELLVFVRVGQFVQWAPDNG